jgi:hypothetical protein
MPIEKLKCLLLAPEEKSWARIIDSIVVLLGLLAAGVLYFMFSSKIESNLLKFSLWGVIITAPFISYMMFRVSNITKIERISILILVLSAAFALLVASVESTKNI